MKEAIRAYLIDPEEPSRETIRRALEATGRVKVVGVASAYEWSADRGEALAPDLVVINLDADRTAATRIIRAISAMPAGPAVLPASRARDSSLLIVVMRAGAREFLAVPPKPGELDEILDHLPRKRAGAAAPAKAGPGLVAVVGADGGVGCTTIAVNLAVALAKVPENAVLLADIDLIYGSADIALDMLPDYTLLEATARVDRVDESLLKRAVARHASGVQVLPRPAEIEDAARVDPEALRKLLGVAKSAFPTVIVDASKSLQSTDFVAFELADLVLVVFQLDLIGLRNTARLVKLLRQDDALAGKIKPVANRVGAFAAEIGLKKAEETLGLPIAWQVPNATKLFHDARSKGVPIAVEGPGSKPHQAILDIAHALRPPSSGNSGEKPKRGFFAALF